MADRLTLSPENPKNSINLRTLDGNRDNIWRKVRDTFSILVVQIYLFKKKVIHFCSTHQIKRSYSHVDTSLKMNIRALLLLQIFYHI